MFLWSPSVCHSCSVFPFFFFHDLDTFKNYKPLTLENIPQLIRFKLCIFDKEEALCAFRCILLDDIQFQFVLLMVILSEKKNVKFIFSLWIGKYLGVWLLSDCEFLAFHQTSNILIFFSISTDSWFPIAFKGLYDSIIILTLWLCPVWPVEAPSSGFCVLLSYLPASSLEHSLPFYLQRISALPSFSPRRSLDSCPSPGSPGSFQ